MSETMAGGLIGGGIMLLTGLLLAAMGNRMADRRFRPNPWAGIRTPSTMKSDEAWYAAHEVGGPMIGAAGTVGAAGGLLGIVAALLDLSDGVVFGLILAGAAVMTLLLLAATVRGARTARDVGDDPR